MEKFKFSEHTAIDLAKSGDERGYRFLLDKYKSYAFSVAIQIVKQEPHAEEIVQDSFIRAFKAISKYNHIGKFSTWLYRIVFNTALSATRKNSIHLESIDTNSDYILDIPDNYKDGFEQLIDQEREHYLQMAISKLSELERVTATLYYLNECTILEIEEITGWNSSTIKSRLFRLRQKLYVELSSLLKAELKDLK